MVRDNFEYADDIIAIFEKEGDNVSLSSFDVHTGFPKSNPRKMVNQFFGQDQTVTIIIMEIKVPLIECIAVLGEKW